MQGIKLKLWLLYKHYTKPMNKDSAPWYFKVYWALRAQYDAYKLAHKPPVEIELNDGAKTIFIEEIDFQEKEEEEKTEEELYYSHPYTAGTTIHESVIDAKMIEHRHAKPAKPMGVRVGRED